MESCIFLVDSFWFSNLMFIRYGITIIMLFIVTLDDIVYVRKGAHANWHSLFMKVFGLIDSIRMYFYSFFYCCSFYVNNNLPLQLDFCGWLSILLDLNICLDFIACLFFTCLMALIW